MLKKNRFGRKFQRRNLTVGESSFGKKTTAFSSVTTRRNDVECK